MTTSMKGKLSVYLTTASSGRPLGYHFPVGTPSVNITQARFNDNSKVSFREDGKKKKKQKYDSSRNASQHC